MKRNLKPWHGEKVEPDPEPQPVRAERVVKARTVKPKRVETGRIPKEVKP